MKRSDGAGTKKLPAALAKRAQAAAAKKKARLAREAKDLLALVARKKAEITDAFYDIGEALAQLKQKDMLAALGRRSFAEMCEEDAGLSATTGEQLVAIATTMTREQAVAMGSKKAMAMVALAAATPERDSPGGLYRKKLVSLPGGGSIAPRAASANEITRAATAARLALRDAGDGEHRGRGRTTTADERELAALLERKLHKLGLDEARVTAVATKPDRGANLRFEGIPAAKVDALKKAIGP